MLSVHYPTAINSGNEFLTMDIQNSMGSTTEFVEPLFPVHESFNGEDFTSKMIDDWIANASIVTVPSFPISLPNSTAVISIPVNICGNNLFPSIKVENVHTEMMVERNCNQTPMLPQMESFEPEQIVDFKHLIYNLLVESFNNPDAETFVIPCTVEVSHGVYREGFQFNESMNPDKRLPELYAQHIRKADLQLENQESVFIQDLYKFYLRACLELLAKYFEKRDKYTFLYDDIPLFVPGDTLEQAEMRMSKMGTRQRKHKRTQSLGDGHKSKNSKHKKQMSLDEDFFDDKDYKTRKGRKPRKY